MGHKAKEYEQNISVLSQQLQHVTEQLSRAEEQASHPPPLLATLQQEMEQMKVRDILQAFHIRCIYAAMSRYSNTAVIVFQRSIVANFVIPMYFISDIMCSWWRGAMAAPSLTKS